MYQNNNRDSDSEDRWQHHVELHQLYQESVEAQLPIPRLPQIELHHQQGPQGHASRSTCVLMDHREQQHQKSSKPMRLPTTRMSRTTYHHLQCHKILDYWSKFDMVGILVLVINADYLSYHMETKIEGQVGEYPTSDTLSDS